MSKPLVERANPSKREVKAYQRGIRRKRDPLKPRTKPEVTK